MPLIIPKTLPAYDALYEENVFVMPRERAASQHIRPLEILILNLMPTKIATETQIARLLANTPLQVHMTLLQTASHSATHVSAAHLEAFYKTFDEVKNNRYDGMIITGAPVETMDFEQVDYWPELCEIMDFSETNVYSTLHVCWGAQAGIEVAVGLQVEQLAHIPECLPGLISSMTTALTTILGYSAMSGVIGGGGLGKVAISYGYYRYQTNIMIVCVVLLILLVQAFQSVGTLWATKSDKRLRK